MAPEKPKNSPTHPGFLHSAQQKWVPVPLTFWLVLSLFLIAAILLAVHAAHADRSASLHLKVQHGFHSGQLSVWIDGRHASSDGLTGYVHKKFGLIPESVQGTLSRTLPVPPGNHDIRVQVSGDDGFNREESVRGDFAANTERTLAVTTRRSGVSVAWQGETNAPSDGPSGLMWLSRYANTLLVTIAGSIISALTGFAVREVPGYIRKRETAALDASNPAHEPTAEDAPKVRSAAAGS